MKSIQFAEDSAPKSVEKSKGVSFYTFKLCGKSEGVCASFTLTDVKRFLTFYMPNMWWMEPAYGFSPADIKPQTQMLLAKMTDNSWLLLLPLIDDEVRAVLQGNAKAQSIEIFYDGTLNEAPQKKGTLLAAAHGKDPFDLMNKTMAVIRDHLKTFRLREEKPMPAFLNQFGWCTWDAFYHSVSEEKIVQGLESFKKGGISPEFMILDDGWQCTSTVPRRAQLISFDAIRQKFPNGIKGTVDIAKKKYGIKCFGVWHAFEGYWCGIIPSPLLPYKSMTVQYPRYAEPTEDKSIPKHDSYTIVEPEEIGKFYNDYHATLKEQGVDMVKVDNQGSFPFHFVKDYLPREKAFAAYSAGLQASVDKHFNGQLINCMCNSSDVYFHFKTANLWRNSDDYFPKRPLSGQHKHLHSNGKTTFMTSTFCWPDWDMFQSYNTGGNIHAAARALSGGPVYVCDSPENHNFEIISRLLDTDGKLLRPDRPALPTEDCLLVDVQTDHYPLKITNKCGDIGLLGIFDCCDVEPEFITAPYSPADIRDLQGDTFAVYSFASQTASVMSRKDTASISLTPETCDIMTISPLKNGFAAIGLSGKFAGPAVFTKVKTGDKGLQAEIRCGGEILFYADRKPASVTFNGKNIKFTYKNGIVRVSAAKAGTICLK